MGQSPACGRRTCQTITTSSMPNGSPPSPKTMSCGSAKQYVTVNNLDIVIVGDRSVIEAPLKATGLAPIAVYNIEGNPLSTQ